MCMCVCFYILIEPMADILLPKHGAETKFICAPSCTGCKISHATGNEKESLLGGGGGHLHNLSSAPCVGNRILIIVFEQLVECMA